MSNVWEPAIDAGREFQRGKTTENMSYSELSNESTSLPWDKFQNWLHCVCVVTFDLELGQAMELVYPGHIKLTDKEKTSICYLSFPDSNSGLMGDTQFHFRVRRCPTRTQVATKTHTEFDRNCPPPLQSDAGHWYGYVFFRQTKDKSIRRGYFQKSVVLISKLPLTTLYTHISTIISPEYFDNGEPSLEAACHDIDQWPYPTPGDTLNLPLMGDVIQVQIPRQSIGTSQIVPNVSLQPADNILPTVYEVCLFTAFQPVLPHIQMLWELTITGEPLVVMSSLPTVCSATVQAVVNMIWPLRFYTDYRPYFTIHDAEFKEYTTRTQAPPSVILGVTNPFFAKTLQHWPHIIKIEDAQSSSKFNKVKKAGNLKTLDSKPGVYTRYKPFLNKDKTVLKRLIRGIQSKRPVEVQNAMLKRYLLELTQSFMIPLERYVSSLMPLQRSISPFKGLPKLKTFDSEEFIKTLEQYGPQLTSGIKGDWIGLYRQFLRSSNFEEWLKTKQREMNQRLQTVHLEMLCKENLIEWARDKQEVEVVDLILRLREKLSLARAHEIPVSDVMMDKVQLHLDSIISSLPDDLQMVLKS